MERGRSPRKKKAKVLADDSMPKAGKPKQQTIKSYGKNGSNRDKYIRKNPRNEIPENSIPIEVISKIQHFKSTDDQVI